MGFKAGWFAALQAMGVPKDSHLRDPGQIPFPSPAPVAQDAPVAIDEEETASMRELVEQIDAHAEPEEMEATSIPTVQELLGEDPPLSLTVQQEVTPPTNLSANFSFICLLIFILLVLFAYVTGMW